MTQLSFAVANDMVVGIAYELRLDDGDVIDDAPDNEPFYLANTNERGMRLMTPFLANVKDFSNNLPAQVIFNTAAGF